MNKQEVGTVGEYYALKYLKEKSYEHIDSNLRIAHGELDIVVKKNNITHIIEVKTYRGLPSRRYNPIENITRKKLSRVCKTALMYAKNKNINQWQVDVVCVWIDDYNTKVSILFIQNIGG